ncbi:NAD(P)-binding protein, partial [Rhizobium ruizarguesonis]
VYDALVIGSGAAGSFAVKELTAQGLSVLLLEAGPAVGPKDFDPARKKAPASSIDDLRHVVPNPVLEQFSKRRETRPELRA